MNAIARSFYAARSVQDAYLSRVAAAESSGAINTFQTYWLNKAFEDEASCFTYNLFLSRHACRPALWAGAFMLRQTELPSDEVFLFSVSGQFQRFASEAALRQGLEQQLDAPQPRSEMLRFAPVDVRPQLAQIGTLTLITQRFTALMGAQAQQAISDFVQVCREDTLTSLLSVPSLRSLVDKQLQVELERVFEGQQLDGHNIQISSVKRGANAHGQSVTSTSLSSTALEYYVKGQLSADYHRTFTGPFLRRTGDNDDAVESRFTQVLKAATEQLPSRMNETLAAYWRDAQGAQPSPHVQSAARLGDYFFQQLLQARHEGVVSDEQFMALQRLTTDAPDHVPVQATRLLVTQQGVAEVLLAGLICIFLPRQRSDVFLFGASIGLKKMPSRARLKEFVLSALRKPATFESIAHYAALDQHPSLAGMAEPGLQIENIDGDVFDHCVQDIRSKQARDFGYLLNQYRGGTQALAAIDHALDVRGLIDPGLLALNNRGRWDSRFVPNTNGLRLTPDDTGGLADLLSLKLPKVQAQRDVLLRHWPTPRAFAQRVLFDALKHKGHAPQDIAHVVVHIFDQDPLPGVPPRRSMALVDALLEHVTGAYALPVNPDHIQVGVTSKTSDEVKPLKSFGGTPLLAVLDHAATGFSQQYRQHLSAFFFGPYIASADDSLLLRLVRLRMVMLRAEVRLNFLDHSLPELDQAIIKAVLGYPVGSRRPALNHFVPDAYSFSLSLGGSLDAVSVANCLLITERGGLESANAGRAIIWTPVLGFEGFESLDSCTAQLETRLLDNALRWEVLDNVVCAEQALVTAHLDSSSDWQAAGQNQWFYFERIEQDCVHHCQISAINKVLEDATFICAQARETQMSAQAFENSAQSLLVEGHAGVTFEHVGEMAETQVFKAALPDWLKNASAAEQLEYANLLQRYQQAIQDKGYYLHDIPDISDYSRTHLKESLALDFTEQTLEPDAIEVVVDTYVAAPVPVGSTPSFLPAASTRTIQTLTQFALNGFERIEGGAMFLRSTNGVNLPVALDPIYVRHLVRKLDIGQTYQQLLKDKLEPASPGVILRQQQFAEQLMLQVMEQALREKLSGTITATAYRYLEHLLKRPDGMARDLLDGVSISIRPLELIAESGREPDLARGVYVVGPQAQHPGPHLLWVMYSQHFSLKEYASEAELLSAIYTDAALQTLLLQRLPVYDRRVYDHGGFIEPHLPRFDNSVLLDVFNKPAPVTLANRPVLGNLFIGLYADNYQLLQNMAASQSLTVDEADWESFKYLCTLFVNTAIMFVPGKLSIPLVVWQGMGLLRDGLASARKGEWVKSVWQFSMSLVVLATSRRVARPAIENGFVPSAADLEIQEQQTALEPFCANDVALVDMVKDLETQIYSDPRTGFNYVQMRGQVFRIQAWRQRWRIYLDGQRLGPLIKLNTLKRWEMDINEPLLGGGPVQSALGSYSALAVNAVSYEIKAIGISSIQRRYPVNARLIREAHGLATRYLQRSQRALRALNAEQRELIKQFFHIETIDQALLDRLSRTIDPMLERFLHPDLSPLTSSKYVYCRSRFNSQSSAFINRLDEAKRVYLTENFFKTVFEKPYALYNRYMKNTNPPFAVGRQMRASFLLHEITHQVLKTEDMHYLNPGFPYPDLLDAGTPFGHSLKELTETLQQCHSPYLSDEHLFQQLDPDTQTWTELASGPAKDKIKSIAEVYTLDEARVIFKKDPEKRVEIMLANADTIVLLLMRLGRVQPVMP